MPLVMAGPTRRWAHELPDVLLTGELPDDQLATLYSGAHALVVASARDGFGLSGVEALACGTPVVACDSPILREVLGSRARFVASGDVAALLEGRRSGAAPRAGAGALELGGRSPGDLGRLRPGALARPDQPRLTPARAAHARTLGAQ